ncbi:MAG TPA: helicase-related protein [Rhizomicrobium sp.]|nr:helicase-related protein [Rhizomicrobium sp.]
MSTRHPADRAGSSRTAAILGPTNTGKTHYAIERMLAHRTGMIGLPLRLLAREVHDRIARLRGPQSVALITGEEKIVPPEARWFVCTTEAMPLDLRTAFLAVDEIQLCADPERGHVFTDRLLHARGEDETLFMGAETMRGAIQRFVPQAHFIVRPRFSDLAYTGHRKLTRLPRRSAIVAFSADDVYGIAELVRRQRGGAAVVLGALSPRTRNAQVALYQSGEVDFLVATDAIGMGLNMDVDHVAFSALEKFDGVGTRPLRPEEIGQIAGRAGRHMNDGTFGVTAESGAPEDETVSRVEGHRYEPVRVLQYRNSALSFQSLEALMASLEEPPPSRGLVRARPAIDLESLRILSGQEEFASMARAPAAVRRLWGACQLPDFRKLAIDEHVKLVAQIFRFLMSEEGAIPEDWFARQVSRLDEVEGDVATLSGRLAQIRTWTYATHRPGWLRDAGHWQEQTRAIEDRLSDALHERLTQRFIDRRTSVLMRRLREEDALDLRLDDSGAVSIGGETIGELNGFRFAADPRAEGIHGRTLRAAALKGLEGEFQARARRFANAAVTDVTLSEHGKIWWDGAIVGRLEAGAGALAPRAVAEADEQLRADLRGQIQDRLESWLAARIAARLEPLIALRNAADARPGTAEALPADARGLAHQLCENLGSLDRGSATLPPDERAALRALRPYGVRFARRSIYLPKLIRPEAASLLALLWAVKHRLTKIPPPPNAGITSFEADDATPGGFLAAAGFRRIGPRAIRLDMLDRLEQELEAAAAAGTTADAAIPKLVSLIGSDRATLDMVLAALGWERVEVAGAEAPAAVWRHAPQPRRHERHKGKPRHRKPRAPETVVRKDSPFAVLAALTNKR